MVWSGIVAIVTMPLAIACGLLFDKLVQGFQREAKA